MEPPWRDTCSARRLVAFPARGEGTHVMATSTVPGAVAAPLTASDHWTRNSATVLTICILGWAFDIYEATIMQLVTPILIKEWGITPATMGMVTTISRWIGLIGTFAFPVFADHPDPARDRGDHAHGRGRDAPFLDQDGCDELHDGGFVNVEGPAEDANRQ